MGVVHKATIAKLMMELPDAMACQAAFGRLAAQMRPGGPCKGSVSFSFSPSASTVSSMTRAGLAAGRPAGFKNESGLLHLDGHLRDAAGEARFGFGPDGFDLIRARRTPQKEELADRIHPCTRVRSLLALQPLLPFHDFVPAIGEGEAESVHPQVLVVAVVDGRHVAGGQREAVVDLVAECESQA